jgi:hypothetical protein
MATDPSEPPLGHPAAPEVVVDNDPSSSLLVYNLRRAVTPLRPATGPC